MIDTKIVQRRILSLAIRGKLVPQDNQDEPISALLDKIHSQKQLASRRKKRPEHDNACKTKVEFTIPSTWQWVKLGDICESCLGKMLDKTKNKGVFQSYLRNINVRWSEFDLSDLLQMRFEESETERYSINYGDLVVCEGGEPGRCAIWSSDTPIKFQKALHRVRCYDGILNKYIEIVLHSYALDGTLEKYYTGSTIKHLTGESLASISIPLPPTNEQKRIISKVDNLSKYIKTLESSNRDIQLYLLKIRNKVLQDAIRGTLVMQDATDGDSSEELSNIIKSKGEVNLDAKIKKSKETPVMPITNEEKLFDIPINWSWCHLSDICVFLSRGKSPKYTETDKTYPVFAQKCNLKQGGISLDQALFLDPASLSKWTDEYKLKTGDILVNSTGTGTVGRTRLFNEAVLGKYPFVVPDSHVSVVRTHNNVCSEYIYYLLLSKDIQSYIEDNLAGSTNQKELYIGTLQNLPVPLPPYKEQIRIVQKLNSIISLIEKVQ